MASRISLTLLLTTLLFGCVSEPPVLSIGSGETRFETFEEKAELPLVMGNQNGHHVWLSLRVTNMDFDRALMSIEEIVDGEPPPRRAPVRVRLEPVADDPTQRELVGWPAQLSEPACVVGKELLLRVSLEDPEGAIATSERVLIPVGLDPSDCEEE